MGRLSGLELVAVQAPEPEVSIPSQMGRLAGRTHVGQRVPPGEAGISRLQQVDPSETPGEMLAHLA